MSATAITAISMIGGIILQMMQAREELKTAALAAGEITVEQMADQDKAIGDLLATLKSLTG